MAAAETSECVFCTLPPERIIFSNEHAVAINDAYPVSPGHCLVIPRKHVPDWWQLSHEERTSITELVDQLRTQLLDTHHPQGFNVGFNDGATAGQTVFHFHMHVIPRYKGDVPDPRGGVRHVIPAKANYLDPEPTEVESAVEARFGEQLDSAAVVQQVLGVLDEGRKSATYKPALLMALAELAAERGEGNAPLVLLLDDVAERVMELYWQQTRPHPAADGSALRQARTPRSRIIGALSQLRADANASANEPLGRIRSRAPKRFEKTRSNIARALAKQPIPRLQRPGSLHAASEYPRFLYDDRDFEAERGWTGDGEPRVVLNAGIGEVLARSLPLLRIAAEDIWTREVADINGLEVEEELLRQFLFGPQRTDLTPVAEALMDLGERHCFWCESPLRSAVEVDHVIPWSHFPNNDLFNLVLTDTACNNDKRDRLVTADLVERWAHRDSAELAKTSAELQWPLEPIRSGRIAAAAYRYLPNGVALWAGRKDMRLFDDEQRIFVSDALEHIIGL